MSRLSKERDVESCELYTLCDETGHGEPWCAQHRRSALICQHHTRDEIIALRDELAAAEKQRDALLEAAKLNMCHWPRCDHTAHVILKQAIERAGG